MSYTYLQGQGAESSAECFSDIPVCVPLRLNPIAGKSCSNANAIASFQSFQSGMTSPPLTQDPGPEQLMLFAEDSPVRTSALGK